MHSNITLVAINKWVNVVGVGNFAYRAALFHRQLFFWLLFDGAFATGALGIRCVRHDCLLDRILKETIARILQFKRSLIRKVQIELKKGRNHAVGYGEKKDSCRVFLFGNLKKRGYLHRLETEADDGGEPAWQVENVARRPDE